MANQKAADAYKLVLYAAVRPGEALNVRAEDIVTMGGERVWQLRETKMDRDFLVPLIGPVAEIINRRYLEVGGKGPLFWARVAGAVTHLPSRKRIGSFAPSLGSPTSVRTTSAGRRAPTSRPWE
jgi:integrase